MESSSWIELDLYVVHLMLILIYKRVFNRIQDNA